MSGLGWALLAGLALAQEGEDDDADRDADVFGEASEDPAAPAPAETDPADDLPFGPRTTDADIAARLGARDDDVVLGGRLYTRVDAAFDEDVPAEDADVASPNLLDLFVDARPNDRLRVFAQGRLQHDWTVADGATDAFGNAREGTKVVLDQLWLKGDVGRTVFFTVGRQRIKWGSGRFWNPTDFLNQQVLDPLEAYDERTGVGLVKVHVPVGAANLYALANVEEAAHPRDVGGALRAEVVAGPAEIALSGAVRRDQPVRLGADVSAGVGPVDLHVEGAVRHGDAGPFWEGELDLETFAFPTERDREDDWIPQVVAGAELGVRYGDEDSVYVGTEWFWNDAGYDDASIYPWLLFEGGYVPFYLGRQYGSAYVYLPSPGEWDDASFTASWLANLSDGSHVGRFDTRVTVLTHLALNGYVSGHFGDLGEFRYGLEIPAVPGVEGLEDGISIAPPLVQVGLGANLEF